MSLPGELRNKIWEELLIVKIDDTNNYGMTYKKKPSKKKSAPGRQPLIVPRCKGNVKTRTMGVSKEQMKTMHSVMLLCRALRRETADHVYGKNTFKISASRHRQWLRQIGRYNSSSVQHLVIQCIGRTNEATANMIAMMNTVRKLCGGRKDNLKTLTFSMQYKQISLAGIVGIQRIFLEPKIKDMWVSGLGGSFANLQGVTFEMACANRGQGISSQGLSRLFHYICSHINRPVRHTWVESWDPATVNPHNGIGIIPVRTPLVYIYRPMPTEREQARMTWFEHVAELKQIRFAMTNQKVVAKLDADDPEEEGVEVPGIVPYNPNPLHSNQFDPKNMTRTVIPRQPDEVLEGLGLGGRQLCITPNLTDEHQWRRWLQEMHLKRNTWEQRCVIETADVRVARFDAWVEESRRPRREELERKKEQEEKEKKRALEEGQRWGMEHGGYL